MNSVGRCGGLSLSSVIDEFLGSLLILVRSKEFQLVQATYSRCDSECFLLSVW